MSDNGSDGSEQLLSIFKALADPIRLRLFALLAKEELCVCHLTEALQLPQSTVSRHLGVLRGAGIVLTRREGKWMYYRLSEGVPLQLLDLVGPITADAVVERGRCAPPA